MKKIIAGALAVLTALSASVTAFAATTYDRKFGELSGNPISEDGVQYGAGDAVEPNQTIYFLIPDSAAEKLSDSKTAKVSVRKTKNAKLVKSVKLVEKKLVSSSGNYTVPVVKGGVKGTDSVPRNLRNTYLAVELNNTTSTDEYKVELTATFTSKKSGVNFSYGNSASANDSFLAAPLNNGDKLALDISFYVANQSGDGDTSVTVGSKGVSIKPVKNETNEITFESSGGDTLAILTFKANSNPDKFYAQLSTKWTSSLLAKFRNTDAVIRRFTPAAIDSSSRPVLMLSNPFDEDDVNPKKVYIYSVSAKGVLSNVTSSFTYDEDEDAFMTRTRTLGTWIISDTKIRLK